MEEESSKKAAQKWQKVLGDRFPVFDDDDKEKSSKAKKFSQSAIVGTTFRGA